jgi:hypothetical protein
VLVVFHGGQDQHLVSDDNCSYTIVSLFIHCSYTVGTLLVHCRYTAFTLCKHIRMGRARGEV